MLGDREWDRESGSESERVESGSESVRARDGVYWRVCESERVGASECGSEREYGSD